MGSRLKPELRTNLQFSWKKPGVHVGFSPREANFPPIDFSSLGGYNRAAAGAIPRHDSSPAERGGIAFGRSITPRVDPFQPVTPKTTGIAMNHALARRLRVHVGVRNFESSMRILE